MSRRPLRSVRTPAQRRTTPDTKRDCHAYSASIASTSRSPGTNWATTCSMPSTAAHVGRPSAPRRRDASPLRERLNWRRSERRRYVSVVSRARWVGRVKVAGSLAVAGAVCAAVLASGSAAAGDGVTPCPRERLRTASGCTSLAATGREIRAIVQQSVRQDDLRAALVRVDLGDRSIARVSAGESMDGVPANLRMNFRIGSVAIPYVIDLLLQAAGRRTAVPRRPPVQLVSRPPRRRSRDASDARHRDLRLRRLDPGGPRLGQNLVRERLPPVADEGAAGHRAGAAAHLRPGDMLSLRPHELHHPRQRDRGRHRQAGGGAAPEARPPPARLAQHQDLLAAGHPATGFCTRTLPTAVPMRTRPSGALRGRSPRA